MSDNLDEIIDSLRALGASDLGARIASKAVAHVEVALKRTLDAGQTPEGEPWVERKKGGRAYANASSRIEVKAHGDLIRVTLRGPEVFGHFGAGLPVRRMIPEAGAGIPQSISEAITLGARDALKEVTR